MNPDVIDVALVMTVLRPGNYDRRADKPSEELLKLVSFFSDACLNGVGMLNASEGNLKGHMHGKPRGASRP
jgi:hypothetical protein